MGANRKMVYLIRKYMPDIQFIHNRLADGKLRDYRKLLLQDEVVRKGEENPGTIPEILRDCEQTRARQMEGLLAFFDRYLKTWNIQMDDDRLRRHQQQMLFDCMAYGFAPDEFNYYGLMDKTPEEKRLYVTDLDRKMMQYQLSDFKDLQFVFDKTATYSKFSKYYKRDAISVASKADYEQFRKYADAHDSMVIKMVSASSGRGVTIEATDKNDIGGQFERLLAAGKCAIEEPIIQSEKLAVFNPTSVNTARIMTFNTRHGIIVGPCFFRTGKAGSFVDNGGSGGIMVGLDGRTGRLNSDGFDEYPTAFKVHPDSGVRFDGFQLPEWDRCIALVREMAGMIPRVGYVGWDMAYSRDNGWVVVEANGGSHIMTQLMYGEGCKPEIEGYMRDMRRFGR